MSASVTTANGVVVVTQVFPQDGNGKVSVPNVTPQIQSAAPFMRTTKVSEMTTMFLRGEPQSLGIVQVFIGLVFMVVSLSALLSPTQFVQAPLFMGIAFVLSGSLTVSSRKGTRLGLIRGTLAVNVISVLVALAGVGYLCMLLSMTRDDSFCTNNDNGENNQRACRGVAWQLIRVQDGIRGLLLVLAVLEVCLAVTVCVFSGKAISRHGSSMVVMESGGAPTTSTASLNDSDEPLLGSEKVAILPPYSP